MPYIGKSPEMGVRTRYYYTVSAGATSVSGSDDNSKSLTFSVANNFSCIGLGITSINADKSASMLSTIIFTNYCT